MPNLKLSIIVPVYNVEQYIEKCISSLLVPNCYDYEIIIVNDGTIDNSMDIVRNSFQDNRIRIIEQENAGLSAARNHGISVAQGEYIWCVDSDDWIETNEIPTIIELLDNVDTLYFGSYYRDEEDTQESRVVRLDNEATTGSELACKNFAHCAQYYIVRSSMFKEYQLSFKEGILHEDSLFTPIFIMHCNSILCYSTPVYHHLKRKGSITQVIKPKRIYDLIYVISELTKFGKQLDHSIKYKWGKCIAQLTNELLYCEKNCKETGAKEETKRYVNNKVIIDYLSHSGRNNWILASFAKILGGNLYLAYSILFRFRY